MPTRISEAVQDADVILKKLTILASFCQSHLVFYSQLQL